MANESQPKFRQKIGNLLQKCAPNPHNVDLEQLIKLLPISLRELAWIVAICEGKFVYVSIPWELSQLRDRVEVLHNIFLTKTTQEIENIAKLDEISALSSDARTDAIYKILGIQWEIAHDYNGIGIPTYSLLSNNQAQQSDSLITQLVLAMRPKVATASLEPILMAPWIKQHNKNVRCNQIIQLLNKICDEAPIRINLNKIDKSIQSYILAWIIVICHREIQWVEQVKLKELELTPLAQITNSKIIDKLQKSGHIHNLKVKCFDEVDLRDNGNVKKLFSYEIPPELVFKLLSNDSIYKIKSNNEAGFKLREPNDFHSSPITMVMSIPKKQEETSKTEQNFNQANYTNDLDNLIDTTLKVNLKTLIKTTFPNYTGQIYDKSSTPHRLVIRVVIIMFKLKYEYQDITWRSVKEFIEEHIVGNHERSTIAKLDDFNDDYFIASGKTLSSENATKKVGDYKRKFKIK